MNIWEIQNGVKKGFKKKFWVKKRREKRKKMIIGREKVMVNTSHAYTDMIYEQTCERVFVKKV